MKTTLVGDFVMMMRMEGRDAALARKFAVRNGIRLFRVGCSYSRLNL